jgi:nucleoid-associated protein YgaU
MIESHLQRASLDFGGSLFTNQAAVLTRMGEVEAENAQLRIRTANLQAQAVQLRNALAVARNKNGGATGLVPEVPAGDVAAVQKPASVQGGKMVRVEKSDTLKKLALRYYGDQGRWREIYEANKQRIKSPGDLRVGQMIVIPSS